MHGENCRNISGGDNIQSQTNCNKILSNKFTCYMVIINLILNSMIYIMTAITEIIEQKPYSGLWLFILPVLLVVFNLLLWVNLAMGIINVEKPKLIFLVLIPIFALLTLLFSIKWNYYNGLFYWLYIIQTILLIILMVVKIFVYKDKKR